MGGELVVYCCDSSPASLSKDPQLLIVALRLEPCMMLGASCPDQSGALPQQRYCWPCRGQPGSIPGAALVSLWI